MIGTTIGHVFLAAPQQFEYTPPQAPAPISGWAVLGQVFYFLLIFAFVVGLTYLMTRFLANKSRPLRRSRCLRVLDQLALAPGKAIYLVDCVDRVLILSCGEKEMTLLSEITDLSQVEAFRESSADAQAAPADFAAFLQSSLPQPRHEETPGSPHALASAQRNVEALLRRSQELFRNGRKPR